MYVTKIILNHYKRVISFCKRRYNANITMTFIGSEKDISKNFIKDNFNETYSYHEFEQIDCKIGYNNIFLNMLTNKFRFSYQKSIEKKPHITLLAGSNDYISINFFEQIINKYNSNEKQLFGVDNFNNGNNKTALDLYDGQSFSNNLIWTTGLSNYSNRQKYKYIGGIIGFNNTLYNSYYEELMSRIITYDEGEIEYLTLQLPNIYKFQSENVFFINIKTLSNSEITNYNSLVKLTKNQLLNFENFDNKFKEYFKNEYINDLINYNSQNKNENTSNEWFIFKKHFIKKNDSFISRNETYLKKNTLHSSQNIIKQKIDALTTIYCKKIDDFNTQYYKIII